MPSSPKNENPDPKTSNQREGSETEDKNKGADNSSEKASRQTPKRTTDSQKRRGSSKKQSPREQSGIPQDKEPSHHDENSEHEGRKKDEKDHESAGRGFRKAGTITPRDSSKPPSGKPKEEQESNCSRSKQEQSKLSLAPEVLNGDKTSQRAHSSRKSDDERLREDSIFDIKEFRPIGYGEPVVDPRVVLYSAPAPCSCYPKTSSRAVPSMLYDQVRCVHHGKVGCPHEGVYKFDAEWSDMYQHEAELGGFVLEEKSYVRGYPRPELDQVSESRRSSIFSDMLRDLSFDRSDDGKGEVCGSVKDSGAQRSEKQHPSGSIVSKPSSSKVGITVTSKSPKTMSHRVNMKYPKTPEPRVSIEDVQEVTFPKIGYTPPTSTRPIPEKISTVDMLDAPVKLSKGSSPDARVLIAENDDYSKDTAHCLSHKSVSRYMEKNRTFKGRYYDPVTDQVYVYEVTHEFGKHMNRWPVKKEKCGT
ncbi:uncharacterized protein [Haliotis asinina]|uniref:uncharacterized protein n=1 Tax=Haliotis asinina TaxID=109174 RepID=UPI0035325582